MVKVVNKKTKTYDQINFRIQCFFFSSYKNGITNEKKKKIAIILTEFINF